MLSDDKCQSTICPFLFHFLNIKKNILYSTDLKTGRVNLKTSERCKWKPLVYSGVTINSDDFFFLLILILFIQGLSDNAGVTGFLIGTQLVVPVFLIPSIPQPYQVARSTSGPFEAHPPALLPVEGSPQPCGGRWLRGLLFYFSRSPQQGRFAMQKALL